MHHPKDRKPEAAKALGQQMYSHSSLQWLESIHFEKEAINQRLKST
jgi:hypothetical protein